MSRLSSPHFVVVLAVMWRIAGTVALGQTAVVRPAVPIDAVTGIIEAFQSHDIVAMGDGHGISQNEAFRLTLIHDPRFAATVNDIVVQLGNARYQNVVDRFVEGEDILYPALRRAWLDTTQTTAGNSYAMIEDLLRTARSVNAALPRERRLRVLLADPPIDWERVKTRDDHRRWLEMRDSYPAALIQVEVLARQRKALILTAVPIHLQRKNILTNYGMHDWRAQTLVSLLESATPTRVFTIRQVDAQNLPVDLSAWPVPSLALIRDTPLGKADFSLYQPSPNRGTIRADKFVPIPKDEWVSLPAEEQFDAVLYLGSAARAPERRSHEVPPALCAEPGFVETQVDRIALAGTPRGEGDRLRQYCAKFGSK